MSKNVFEKLAQREHENDTKLGMPSTDPAHFDRRMHLMSVFTGGNGFSNFPKRCASLLMEQRGATASGRHATRLMQR